MSIVRPMSALNLANKRVMIREDLNVPMQDGEITSDERIRRALPTIQAALSQNAAVIVLSHLGRPIEGEPDDQYSLAPIAAALSQALQQEVPLIKDWLDGVDVAPGHVVLCENVRFNVGEASNDAALSQKMAALCDVFVMDAFAVAHRSHASTVGVVEYANIACAGPLLASELETLSTVFSDPKHPVVAIVGGSKVSTKFELLDALLDKVDVLIPGGGIANTFLAAAGHSIGQSLCEADWVAPAKELLESAKQKEVKIALPIDVSVATKFAESATATDRCLEEITEDEMILDVGPKTAESYAALMANAATIVWNGPVGVFEFPAFSRGTQALADAIVASPAFSIAGGGDTIAALDQFSLSEKIGYICTGGGAFLEYLEGKALPGIVALERQGKVNE
jgi:phosphoglycerate kinase